MMEKPPELTFENIAKQFMALASERYPSAARVLQTAQKLGIADSIPAQIIVFNQMLQAIDQVAKDYIFKPEQKRDELRKAIIEALEDLEDKLEDLEDADADTEV